MPVLVLQPPSLPALQTYIALSCLSLAWCFLYARDTLETVETAGLTNHGPDDHIGGSTLVEGGGGFGANESEKTRLLFGIQEEDWEIVKLCRIMMADVWSVLSLINLVFCTLILVGRLVQHVVFGDLRASERQHMKDKLWKFIFYKFIIIFGVLNVQTLEEMGLWMAWFAALAFLHTLSGICRDRFEYLSFSPSSVSWAHGKVLLLLVTIIGLCLGLIVLCCYMGALNDWNILLFTVSEIVLLIIRSIYVILSYGIHLYDLHYEGVWERRSTIVYYTDLVVELLALCVDFIHHFHMLLWGNVFLSMASLVICMELRYLYNEIQRRIHRHRNYKLVVQNMQANFPLATDQQLTENNDDCAICWEEMTSARKLPCNHLFHNTCLRSWLEQETSCPTCRHALNIHNREQPSAQAQQPPTAPHAPGVGPLEEDATGQGVAQPVRPRRARNHFFHFDGSRFASWIPSFSVEVSHRHLLQRRAAAVHTSQLNNMASQVQQMFPDYPMTVLIEDLRTSRSVEVTIDNILEGRLTPPLPSDAPSEPSTPTDQQATPTPPPSISSSHAARQVNEPAMYDTPGSGTNNRQHRLLHPHRQGGEPSHYQGGQREMLVDGGGDRTTRDLPISDPSRSSLPEGSDSDLPIVEGVKSVPGRFSKSAIERQVILKERKELLLQQAQRRFRSRVAIVPPSFRTAPPSEDSERTRRRQAAYEAAMRRIVQQR